MAKQPVKAALNPSVSLIVKIKSMSVMSIALSISLLVHLVILSIHFEPELKKFSDKLPVLEVVLVNTKTKAKPENTEVYAQANLDRGGNTDLDRKMKTALPALKQQKADVTLKPVVNAKQSVKAADEQSEETQAQKNVAALERQAQALMTQLEAKHTVESQQVQKAKATEADTAPQESQSKKINIQDITAAALEMDRLEALIAKQQDEYQKRPKRKFVGGRAQEYRYALYVEAWRQKVEKIGNLNYPEAAKNLKLYGQLQLTVSIKADGSIESIEINRSSGHKVLDAAAKHIVELGAPYARFPDDVRKEIDVLSITRTWTFTKEESLATE
ncbi:MAG: TonB family protein [Methylotenera sp.]|uniref:energy transducer TonB n=1 Tax=Methylotenera sp. TaxID=2051956 RepID=UPI00271E5C57|nr:TonB family protein [Methylotenera sp.]MDO9151876.1 TonB family protein [Methylotenera sp.]